MMYVKQEWENGKTAATAERMNHIEEGIYENSQLNKQHYSTSEQMVGTWTDGKPLYKKTIIYQTDVAGEWVQSNHNIPNIDKIVNHEINIIMNNGATIPIHYENTNNYFLAIPKRETINTKINPLSWSQNPIYATLYYTKTTDIASTSTASLEDGE